MKTRLSSTIWMLVIWTSVALFAVLGLAYKAGNLAGEGSVAQGVGSGNAMPTLFVAGGVAVFTILILMMTLPRRVLTRM